MLDRQLVRPATALALAAWLAAALSAAAARPAQQGQLPERPRLLTAEASSRPALSAPLAEGRVLFVESRTEFLHAPLLEEKLMARPEFGRLGLSITREAREADLYVEVERASFTTKFTYTVLDPATRHVLATGQVNSLFGTASGKIAKRLLATLAAARRS
jgi:hypothetical protein